MVHQPALLIVVEPSRSAQYGTLNEAMHLCQQVCCTFAPHRALINAVTILGLHAWMYCLQPSAHIREPQEAYLAGRACREALNCSHPR